MIPQERMFGLLQQVLQERDTLKVMVRERERHICFPKATEAKLPSETLELKRRNSIVNETMDDLQHLTQIICRTYSSHPSWTSSTTILGDQGWRQNEKAKRTPHQAIGDRWLANCNILNVGWLILHTQNIHQLYHIYSRSYEISPSGRCIVN